MKQLYNIGGMLIACVALFSSCDEENEAVAPTVQYIELSELKKTMSIGTTSQLGAIVLPDAVIDKTITWKTDDESIATIDSEGNITAIAEGETKISAIVNNVTALCALTVVPVAVESVTLNKDVMKMSINETLQLIATVLPENATYKDITWTSSNEQVATVNNDGLVTTIGTGNTTITATSGDKSAVCNLVVIGNDPLITSTELTMKKYETKELEVVLPLRLEGKTIVWNTSVADVVTVTVNQENSCFAIVSAVGIGSTTVTATIESESVACEVTVQAPKEEVEGNTAIMNLSLYSGSEEVETKIKELDGKGITVYKLYGNFAKLGNLFIDKSKKNNPFLGTGVIEIDFTGIDANSWPDVTVPNVNVTMKGMPNNAFNNGTGDGFGDLQTLKKIVLPESCKVLGKYCFQNSYLETLIAPGVEVLGESFLNYPNYAISLYLTTENEFKVHSKACAAHFNECSLYLNFNKSSTINGNQYFGRTWKSVETVSQLN